MSIVHHSYISVLSQLDSYANRILPSNYLHYKTYKNIIIQSGLIPYSYHMITQMLYYNQCQTETY